MCPWEVSPFYEIYEVGCVLKIGLLRLGYRLK